MRKVVAGKLHGIYVTEANLNYHGSITLDPDHCEEAGILPMEFVEIWNKNSGARITTYVILGERGSRCCILNGAAARTCQAGDQIIICNSIYLGEAELTSIKPKILTFDENNVVRDRLSYSVSRDERGRYAFDIRDENSDPSTDTGVGPVRQMPAPAYHALNADLMGPGQVTARRHNFCSDHRHLVGF